MTEGEKADSSSFRIRGVGGDVQTNDKSGKTQYNYRFISTYPITISDE